jgi:hypothetical protein
VANIPFSASGCGKTRGTTTPQSGALNAGDQVEINRTVDLSSCIVGNNDACVYSIVLTRQAGFFSYVVNVVAQGPRGIGSGWLNLSFTDRAGETYSLGIYSSAKQQHTVAYNSDQPGIVRIDWSD